MRISPIGFQPYVYNTNAISRASMDKISAIPEDALASQVDLGEEQENENPLKPGQSAHFADILVSQMSMSRMNEIRVMSTGGQKEETADESAVEDLVIGAPDDNFRADQMIPEDEMMDDALSVDNQNAQQEPSLYRRMNAAGLYMANMIA